MGRWTGSRTLHSILGIIVLLLTGTCSKSRDAIVSIAVHPTNPGILYVATNESVYKTRDGGTTWASTKAWMADTHGKQ